MFKTVRYFLELLFAQLYFLFCSLLSIEAASRISGKIFEVIGPKLKASKIAYKNLTLCLPHLTHAEKKIIIGKMWNNLGRIVGEIPHWQNMPSHEYSKRITLKDHSNGLFKKAKNGLFLSAHYGNWELFPRFLTEQNLNFCLVYRPANNPYVDNLINRTRKKHKITLIKKGVSGLRSILENLKLGKCVGMLIDQKTNDGIDVPFFKRPTKTTPAPANLALKYDMPIIPTRIKRTIGANYIIEIFPPVVIEPQDDALAIMTKVNYETEQWIQADPTQWFWVHKRWDKSIYHEELA